MKTMINPFTDPVDACSFCPSPACPPVSPCPPPLPWGNTAYAQYSVTSNAASGSDLPFRLSAQSGDLVQVVNNTMLTLAPGHVYQIGYTFLASPGDNQYFQIVPSVAGTPRLLYSAIGSASGARNASVSGSFLVTETTQEAVTLTFRLTYPEGAENIDLSGVVLAVPVANAPLPKL